MCRGEGPGFLDGGFKSVELGGPGFLEGGSDV